MSGEETLLDIAKRNWYTAQLLWKNMGDDEGYLNIIAYHLQQAVELTLKHALELEGIEYPKTHDIDDLLNRYPGDEFDSLLPWAAAITNMEAKTRDVKNYRVSLKTIKAVFPLVETMLNRE